MRTRALRDLSAALLSAGLLVGVAGCASSESSPDTTGPRTQGTTDPSPGGSATAPEPAPVVDIRVGADGSLEVPTGRSAGAHVFQVSAVSIAQVMIIEPAPGYGIDQLIEDFGPHASEQEHAAAAARFEQNARVLGGTWSSPGGTWSFARTLDEGTYWFVDLAREPGAAGDDDVLDPSRIVSVTVSGDGTAASLPAPDAVASASDDRTWTLPETIPAAGTLRITNGTSGSHQLVLERIPEGTSPEDRLAQLRVGEKECPCDSPAPLSGGEEFLWVYDLPPGDYVVLDRSIGDQGYPQYNGAGASLVRLV